MADVYLPHPKWVKYACNVHGKVLQTEKNVYIAGHRHVSVNLRWASKKEQGGNTKANKRIEGVATKDGLACTWFGSTAASRALKVSVSTVDRALRSGQQVKGFVLAVKEKVPV